MLSQVGCLMLLLSLPTLQSAAGTYREAPTANNLKDKSLLVAATYDVQLNGVNTGRVDTLDRLEAEFNFLALSEGEQTLLEQGELVMDYRLTRADQTVADGQWTFSQTNECRMISGVDQPGTYQLVTRLGNADEVNASIIRPDLSFAGTGIGDEDVVPEIWEDFAVQDRTVTLWNRVYQFGDGPLPTEIRAYGRSLLEKPPKLIIETPQGVADIQYQVGPPRNSNCAVTFTGTGQAAGFTLDYATTVEFDGMIKFGFTIKGCPEITSMRLEWRVKPEFCHYLMTPLLQEGKETQFEFQYPNDGWLTAFQLWLVSEGKGGFAYSMSHDANWVYDPAQPVFFVNKASGQCSVTMITRTVTLPESTPYQALFIATPTRPLPARNRVIRFGDSSRSDTPRLGMTGGEGLTGVFTFEPHETDLASYLKLRVPNTVSAYGAANSLTDASDVALYFKKYWDIPGAYPYTMSYRKPLGNGAYGTEYHCSVPACNTCLINDYYLYNIKKLLEHPYGDRIWQIYYDLSGNDLCGNDQHGCAFTDKFGRNIKTFALLSKRKLVERTVRFCHAHNRTVILHAQRSFTPFLNGLADYHFPGEQHNRLLMLNPFGYTDEIPDALYRSEYNRNVLGVGVILLPALGQANIPNYDKPEGFSYTEAMMAMLLSHDIETSQDYAAGVPIQKVWNALEKYGVQSPETRVHLYYNQQEITSSPSDVRITWYECPENQRVLILSNPDSRPRNATIDVGTLAPGDFLAHEEYVGADIPVVAGKFTIVVPSRSFRVVAFPPKAFYPVQDAMDTVWGAWIGPDSTSEFTCDYEVGRNHLGSLKMQAEGGGCFLNNFPVRPGRTYSASVYAKRNDVGFVSLAFQGKDQTDSFLVPPQSVKAQVGSQWQKIDLSFTIPDTGAWAGCHQLLITLGGDDGTIWFDDFTITEAGGTVPSQSALSPINRYVALTSTTPMPGYTSWAMAATNIQDAIDASYDGDTVWVSNGVYAVGGRIHYPAGTFLTNRVVIDKAITVRSANNDPANTVIRGAWDSATNGPAAVRCVYMAAGSLIGFTVTNGATWTYPVGTIADNNNNGGGVFCVDTTPMISNCVIRANAAKNQGGGVYRGTLVGCQVLGNVLAMYGAGAYSSVMSNCMLIGNSSPNNGGGAYQGTLYDCGLVSNSSFYGGGGAMSAVLYNCTLTDNKAPSGPGGGAQGGSLYNCILTGNYATGTGGGAQGSTLYNCTLNSNTVTSSGGGGAALCTLYNCRLIGNDGTYAGGVLQCTLYNCLLSGNTSIWYGGGGAFGSTLYNSTVVGNSTDGAGGGVFGGTAINCIIYHNSAIQKDANWSSDATYPATFTNCCTMPAQVGWSVGNITENPMLVDWAAGDYHLRGASPCIDVGMSFSWMTLPANVHSKDLDGKSRLSGVSVDIGVYEYVPDNFLILVR